MADYRAKLTASRFCVHFGGSRTVPSTVGPIEGVEDGLIDILDRDDGRLDCIIDFMGLFVGKNVGSNEGGIDGCSYIDWILDGHRLFVHLVCYEKVFELQKKLKPIINLLI